MLNKKGSFLLSFFVGGLIGSGMTLLLAQYLARKQSAKAIKTDKTRMFRGEAKEQAYENGIYCAPEGADMRYDMEEDLYYSNGK